MDLYEALFGNSFDFKNGQHNYDPYASMDILMHRREEFEKNLDDMWRIYSTGNVRQIVEYQKQVDSIKAAGLKVLRNSAGKHKIVMKK